MPVVIVDDEHAPAAEAGGAGGAIDSRRCAAAESLAVQPTSALRMASMPDSSCATSGRDLLERALRAVF